MKPRRCTGACWRASRRTPRRSTGSACCIIRPAITAGAVELIGRAVALRPDAHLYHGNLAEAYRAAGDHERAAESCRAALRLWPDYPEALCNLGTALTALKRHAEAVESLRRAVELRPRFVVANNNLGIALRELGQLDEALGHFRRAVELEPAFAPARTNLGQMLLSRGAGRGGPGALPGGRAPGHRTRPSCTTTWAMSCGHSIGSTRPGPRAVQAVQLDANLAPANAHIGLILQKRGHLAEAVPWLNRAVELEPDGVAFWEWLAELHDERDESAASIPCWERVLALDPRPGRGAPVAGPGLAGRRASGGGPRALPGRRWSCSPTPAHRLLNLGWLHELLGEMDQAEAAFRAALERQPKFPDPARAAGHPAAGQAARRGPGRARGPAGRPRRWPRDPEARLLFGLAHVLDGRGDYARAADCLARANAITLEQSNAGVAIIRRPSTSTSSTAWSGRSIAASSPGWPAPAWTPAGRSSSSACRGRARR